MIITSEMKKLFIDDKKYEFSMCVLNAFEEDIKELKINKRFEDKLIKDLEIVRDYINDVVFDNDNYELVKNKIMKYCAKKRYIFRSIYTKPCYQNVEINFEECDNYIDIIKRYLEGVSANEILFTKYNREEEKIIKTIINGENPYNIISKSYPASILACALERITTVIEDSIIKTNVKKRIENSNQLEIFYLSKIIVVKNWASKLPKDIKHFCFNKGLQKLSDIIRTDYVYTNDVKIRSILNNMSVLEISSPNKSLPIIPSHYIDEYLETHEYERVIASYYFSDLDDEFKPESLVKYKEIYGSEIVNYMKEKAMSDIAKSYMKDKKRKGK